MLYITYHFITSSVVSAIRETTCKLTSLYLPYGRQSTSSPTMCVGTCTALPSSSINKRERGVSRVLASFQSIDAIEKPSITSTLNCTTPVLCIRTLPVLSNCTRHTITALLRFSLRAMIFHHFSKLPNIILTMQLAKI